MSITVHLDSFRYLWEVLENNEYSFLFKGLIVMDLGCNIGSFSLWIEPFATQIHAIDMNEHAISLLNQTLKDSEIGNTKTYVAKIDGVNGLASFMSGHGIPYIDVLKMDIEGDEFDVVNGDDFPCDRIQTIIGEHHYSGTLAQSFHDRLNDLGYRYTELPDNHFIARRAICAK